MSMKSMRSIASHRSSHKSEDALSKAGHEDQVYTEVTLYKGNTVAVRRIDKPRVTLTRDDLLELKIVSKLSTIS